MSAASVFEVGVKWRLRRERPNDMPMSAQVFLEDAQEIGLMMLPVSANDAAEVDLLEEGHPDPFDRLLVAQARVRGLRLVTADKTLAAFDSVALLV